MSVLLRVELDVSGVLWTNLLNFCIKLMKTGSAKMSREESV